MKDIAESVEKLFSKDNKAAYAALLELEAESRETRAVYPFFDRFAEMLKSGSSYIRARGLLLIADNARWDSEGKTEKLLDEYLAHILDEKPITARQVIRRLPDIASAKPELVGRIRDALKSADTSIYNQNMRPLVDKDIAEALSRIG